MICGQMRHESRPFVKHRSHAARRLVQARKHDQGTIWIARASRVKSTAVIYFDHNATSPLSPPARQAWLAATERYIANPSSPHRLAARAEVALAAAHQQAAAFLRCSEFDLVWTSGATEANNAVFHHSARVSKGEAWISAIEHPSVIAAANHWFPGNVRALKVNSDGVVDLDYLASELKHKRPALVSIMAAN